jgi:UDP-N-acetylglucosamine diphosphorylase / glucose-1-phosphate thymidylyltransferase / UDP-N-acetylgalactosamine diphosphorylase / glucosamine-1-phosphate N-acetyltransferase / galactosamine-1-phosphate N-acetyltransferase
LFLATASLIVALARAEPTHRMIPPIVLLENESSLHLYPFTEIRSLLDLRVGIFTIREKWQHLQSYSPVVMEAKDASGASMDNRTMIPANLIPMEAWPGDKGELPSWLARQPLLDRPWQMPALVGAAIEWDLQWVREHHVAVSFPGHVTCVHPEKIFIESGARLEHCILNAEDGPIYIGKQAHIMDGAIIRGPVTIGECAVVKLGARIYGATSIGPHCTVGGEVKQSILMGYSNKAHDGYLGDSVIGEWCNLGAGTSCSNVQNTARPVKMWNKYLQQFEDAGQKCGLVMGDYSRAAINTSFNTGTLVGTCCNIFANGVLTPKYIPSFSWGMDRSRMYKLDRVLEDIQRWMLFKNSSLPVSIEAKIKQIYPS